MKKIWIWNHYATDMYLNRSGRHFSFAKHLTLKGFDVTIFSASSTHKSPNTILKYGELFTVEYSEGIRFVIVRAYQNAVSKFGRIMNMYSFSKNAHHVAAKLSRIEGLPDIIMASSVHPFTLIEGLKFAKKKDIPCICEIRDLWPESLIAYGFLRRDSLLSKYLYHRERLIYEQADALVFTMEGGAKYIAEHGWSREHGGRVDLKKVFYINNGVDIEYFDKKAGEHEGFKSELFLGDTTNFIYTGSIRTVNDLELLIKPMATLIDKGANIRLILVGDGDKRAILQEKYAFYMESIIFIGSFPKEYIPSLLKRSDICVVCSRQVSVSNYGISQNKLFDYMAAGKPILSLEKSFYNPVSQYQCGITSDSQNEEDVAKSIQSITQLSDEDSGALGLKARTAAQDFDFRKLTDRLIDVIKSVR